MKVVGTLVLGVGFLLGSGCKTAPNDASASEVQGVGQGATAAGLSREQVLKFEQIVFNHLRLVTSSSGAVSAVIVGGVIDGLLRAGKVVGGYPRASEIRAIVLAGLRRAEANPNQGPRVAKVPSKEAPLDQSQARRPSKALDQELLGKMLARVEKDLVKCREEDREGYQRLRAALVEVTAPPAY